MRLSYATVVRYQVACGYEVCGEEGEGADWKVRAEGRMMQVTCEGSGMEGEGHDW